MRKVSNGFGRVLMVFVALAVVLGLACVPMTSARAEDGGTSGATKTGGLAVRCESSVADGCGLVAESGVRFSFTLHVVDNGVPVNGTFGGWTFVDGSVDFTVGAGNTVFFRGLPDGATFTVEPQAEEGYVIKALNYRGEPTGATSASGKIFAGGTNQASFSCTFNPAVELSLPKLNKTGNHASDYDYRLRVTRGAP